MHIETVLADAILLHLVCQFKLEPFTDKGTRCTAELVADLCL